MESANDNFMAEKSLKVPSLVGGKAYETPERKALSEAFTCYLEIIKKPIASEGSSAFTLQAKSMTNAELLEHLKEFSTNPEKENHPFIWAVLEEVAKRRIERGLF